MYSIPGFPSTHGSTPITPRHREPRTLTTLNPRHGASEPKKGTRMSHDQNFRNLILDYPAQAPASFIGVLQGNQNAAVPC